jgi:hypothetical protein
MSYFRSRRSRVGATVIAAAVSTLSSGWAAAQTSSDQAAAEALFKQGRDLMTAGQLADACPKFAESQRLDPAPGTLLNLATCYERNGQIASAWVTYKEAASAARKVDQNDRARMARDKAAELEPKLPTLTIVVPSASDRGDLELRRDGQSVGRAEWGVPIPVDPGPHVIDAAAPGRKGWQGKTQVAGVAAKQSIEVPLLEPLPNAAEVNVPAPAPPPVVAPAPVDQTPSSPGAASSAGAGQRTTAWVVGGVGVAGLLAGGALGIVSAIDHGAATDHCVDVGSGTVCNASGYAQSRDAEHAATAADIALAAGGTLVVVAAILYFTAPTKRAASAWTAAPIVGARSGGVAVEGSF